MAKLAGPLDLSFLTINMNGILNNWYECIHEVEERHFIDMSEKQGCAPSWMIFDFTPFMSHYIAPTDTVDYIMFI